MKVSDRRIRLLIAACDEELPRDATQMLHELTRVGGEEDPPQFAVTAVTVAARLLAALRPEGTFDTSVDEILDTDETGTTLLGLAIDAADVHPGSGAHALSKLGASAVALLRSVLVEPGPLARLAALAEDDELPSDVAAFARYASQRAAESNDALEGTARDLADLVEMLEGARDLDDDTMTRIGAAGPELGLPSILGFVMKARPLLAAGRSPHAPSPLAPAPPAEARVTAPDVENGSPDEPMSVAEFQPAPESVEPGAPQAAVETVDAAQEAVPFKKTEAVRPVATAETAAPPEPAAASETTDPVIADEPHTREERGAGNQHAAWAQAASEQAATEQVARQVPPNAVTTAAGGRATPRRRRPPEPPPPPRTVRRPSRMTPAVADAAADAAHRPDDDFVAALEQALDNDDYAAVAVIARERDRSNRETQLWCAVALSAHMRDPTGICDNALVELTIEEIGDVSSESLRPGERALMVAAGLHAAIAGSSVTAELLDPAVVEQQGPSFLITLTDLLRPMPASHGSLIQLLAREAQGVVEIRKRLRELAEQARRALNTKRFNFARATLLWERWQDPRTEPERVGRVLQTVAAVGDTTDTARIAAIVELAESPILAAISTQPRARKLILADDGELRGHGSHEIMGPALSRLLELTREAHRICKQAIGLARQLADTESDTQGQDYWDPEWHPPLREAALQVRAVQDELGQGLPAADRAAGIALRKAAASVASLIIDEVGPDGPEPSESWMLTHGAYLRSGNVSLADNFVPDRPSSHADVVLASLAMRDRRPAFQQRLSRFEFGLAAATLALAAWEGQDVNGWNVALESERRRAEDVVRDDANLVREEIERGWSLGYLAEETWRELTARVEGVLNRVQGPEPLDRPLVENAELRQVIDVLERQRSVRDQEVRACADGLVPDNLWRDDVHVLIDAGDLASAEDLMMRSARREEYHPLGLAAMNETLDPLEDLAVAETLPLAAPEHREALVQAIEDGGAYEKIEFTRLTDLQSGGAATAVRAWFELTDMRRPIENADREHAEQLLHDVLLPALGLVPFERSTSQTSLDQGFPLVRALRARPVGMTRHPYFGSLAKEQYDLRIGFGGDALAVERIVDWSTPREANRRPVIALLFARLPRADRDRYLALARVAHRDAPVALVDTAALVAILAGGVNDLGATLRVVAPFGTSSPYVPDQPGEVPHEIFFGRNQEIADILDPGPRAVGVVYGGRRLGKTALLSSVARSARVSSEDVATVFIDLLSSFGRGRDPSAIWSALLKSVAIALKLERQPLRRRDPEGHVLETIQRWLDEGSTQRRLLILLDECDDFLDQDSMRSFATVEALQRIAVETGRVRFVFTGLHQVKRFDAVANLRFARFGRTVGVGPLNQADAMRLVLEPLHEVGFRFQDRAAAYRLLTVTRCQPSLLQLCCHELVNARHRQLGRSNPTLRPPYRIQLEDVEHALERIAGDLKQRLDQTLNLDPRYRAIALVLGRDARDGGAGLRAPEIRRNCVEIWSAAFSTRTDQFVFEALLEELQTLGVIAPVGNLADGRLGLSSPIWLNLLGSRQQITQGLETVFELGLPMSFEPRAHRPALGDAIRRRSALTLHQTESIWRERRGVRIIVGSRACFSDRVVESLQASVRPIDNEQLVALPDGSDTADLESSFRRQLQRVGQGASKLVVLSALDLTPEEVVRLWRRSHLWMAGRSENVRGAIVAFPSPALLSLLDQEMEFGGELVTPLRRWDAVGLAHWAIEDQGLPLIDAQHQRRFLRATGGWPKLVEEVIRVGSAPLSASTLDARLLDLTARLATPEGAAEFVVDVGVPSGDGACAAVWNGIVQWGEAIGQTAALTTDLGDLIESVDMPRPDEHEIRYAFEALLSLGLLEQIEESMSPKHAYVRAEPVAAAAWRILNSVVPASS